MHWLMNIAGEQENINIYKIQIMKKWELILFILFKILKKLLSKNKKWINNIKMIIILK